MRIARWKSWLTLLLPGLLPVAGFGQQPSLTLRQAVDRALGQNPLVAVAKADVQAARADVSIARDALLPRLNLSEDLSRGNDPVYVFGTKLRQQRFAQNDFAVNALNRPVPVGDFASRVSGQWMLFNWFETQRQIEGARLGAQSARSAGGAVNQAVVLQVVEAYEAVLYKVRQQAVAAHEEQTAQALLHDAGTRVKAGLAIDSDLLGAEVNLAERQQERIAADGALETAWAGLEAAMGDTESPRSELQPMEAKNFPDGVLADDVAMALRARPDLTAMRQQNSAQRQVVRAAQADLLPQISAYGNWEADRPTLTGNGGNNWVAGAQLNLDILPLGKWAHLEKAKAAEQKAAAQQQAQEQQIRFAVRRAFIEHQTAEHMAATAHAAMDQSTESLRILRNRYESGLATMTDLLRAEDAQRQSQSDYWRAACGNTIAYAELLYATGQLTPDTAEKLQ